MRPYHHRFLGVREDRKGFALSLLYYATLIAGIVGPFTTVPQILKVFSGESIEGVSLVSWALFAVLCLPFIGWGIVRRDMPIIVTYILWVIADSLVVFGVLLYS